MQSTRLAIPILFAVVFIDMVGFGILVPLIPFYVARLGAGPELITLIIAVHPLSQSLAMPVWGTLSDRFGRRPILLASMLGHAVAYLVLGFAGSLWMLLLSRVLSGGTSANLSTAYACISDITDPEDRAASLGKISAAFGLGFAVGPALGGLLAGGGEMADANFLRPAIAASLFSIAAFFSILVFLPETLPPEHRSGARAETRSGQLQNIGRIARRPIVTMMIGLCLIVIMCMAVRESIFPLWANYRLGLNARELGWLLAYAGGLICCIQLFGIGRFTARFGELNLVRTAVICLAASWACLIMAGGMATLLVAMTFGALGTAFFQTSMQSLLSKRAGTAERGVVLGVYQSSSSMARFLGQAGSGTMFGQLGQNAPFALGIIAMVPAFFLTLRIGANLSKTPASGSADHV